MWRENQNKMKEKTIIYDTACSISIRKRGEKVKKGPDVVGIGFAKSGTGTLSFLDCHPSIVYRDIEPAYFLKSEKLSFELEIIPKATQDEILIEKSPIYSQSLNQGDLKKLATVMKRRNEKLKIFAIIIDPVKRLYSHIKMCHVEGNLISF